MENFGTCMLYRNRMYDPETGRFTQMNPLGFGAGDVNFYRYVGNDPVNWTDPLGLKVWNCKKPLDALDGTSLDDGGKKSGSESDYNPLFHEYCCIEIGELLQCFGQQSDNGKPYGGGMASNDVFNADWCEERSYGVEKYNECMEDCMYGIGDNPERPWYGLTGPGTNCQEWVEETEEKCHTSCLKSYW